jgi:AraC-like DNA-binding protein
MGKTQVQYLKPDGLEGLELLSCPDVNYLFPPHFHEAYCIWLNSSGGEHYRHRGHSSILQPDNFGIIAPGEVHENYACANDQRNLLTFYLSSDQLQTVAAQIKDRDTDHTEFRTGFYLDNESQRKLINLHQLLRNPSDLMERETAFLELLFQLINRHAVNHANNNRFGRDSKRINRLIELFHAHYDQDLSLTEFATEFDCTPYHLIRFFKRSVGLSPHAYLIQLRLEKAKQLITSGSNIVDAALDTGFTDQSHLTRHFKSKFGVTPGAYRRQILN